MAYDEALAQRVQDALARRRDVEEKRMFGGVAFMVRGHMAVGVNKDHLMVRVAPSDGDRWLSEAHVRPMDFTGKPMRGFLFVDPAGVRTTRAVAKWVERALAFNATLPAKNAKANAPRGPKAAPRKSAPSVRRRA